MKIKPTDLTGAAAQGSAIREVSALLGSSAYSGASTFTFGYTGCSAVTFPDDCILSSVCWQSETGDSANIQVSVYADASGAPGALLATSIASAGNGVGENERFLVTPLVVAAGTTLWLAVFADNTFGIRYSDASPQSKFWNNAGGGVNPAPSASTFGSKWTIYGRGFKSTSVPILDRFKLPFFFTSSPLANEVLGMIVADVAFFIPKDFGGDQYVKVGNNPTATFVIKVKKNDVIIGNLSINTAGAVTRSTLLGANLLVAKGDVISFVAQSTTDATLANVAAMLWGGIAA